MSSLEKETEHESAWAVSSAAAGELARLATSSSIVMDNLYYDDRNKLRRADTTLRARFIIDRAGARTLPGKVTLKVARSLQANIRIADELSGAINVVDPPLQASWADTFWPAAFRTQLLARDARELRQVGTMRVVRTPCMGPSGAFLLDALQLPDGLTYHEVEIEQANHAAHAKTIAWLQSTVPDAVWCPASKYERLCRSLLM